MPETATASTTLGAECLTKRFGSNLAVSEVSLVVSSGEIVALVGCNGSGKSTLLKTIYGTLTPDSGCAKLNGVPLRSGNPHEARARGIELVFQDKDEESRLCPGITVIENLFLGREPTSTFGLVELQRMHALANGMAERYKLSIPPLALRFNQLSGGQQKTVAIARALLSSPRILLLDEPTASLGVTERAVVHRAIAELKSSGVGIILCSHSLEEVTQVADRVAALRSGRLIADEPLAAIGEKDLALLMSK